MRARRRPMTVHSRRPVECAVLSLVLWVAIRHGIAGVPMANVLSASVAQFHDRLWLFQVCVGIVAATGLMLGIVVTERDASGRRRHAALESAADPGTLPA